MNSNIGPSFTDPGLSAKDICDIVLRCREAGVTHLSYGSLRLSFTEKLEDCEAEGVGPSVAVFPRETEEPSQEDVLGELLLTDPAEYERRIEQTAYLDAENNQRTEPVLRRG